MFNKLKEWFTSEAEDSISSLFENKSEYEKASKQLDDFDRKYFEQIDSGEACQQFLSVGSQQDCVLIQSLLFAENIPSYVENQNINRICGAISTTSSAAFALKLFILCKDYDKAYNIVVNYCNSQKQNSNLNDEKPSFSKGAAIVTGLVFATIPPELQQKGVGITILPKITDKNHS